METSSLYAGLWAGFVATIYLSLFMIAKGRLGLTPAFDPLGDIAALADKFAGVKLSSRARWIGHFIMGSFVWGVSYAVFQPALPGGEPWVKGLVFGALAWLVSMVLFMPMADEGFFGKKIGVPGVGVGLLLHLVYGFVVGNVYAY